MPESEIEALTAVERALARGDLVTTLAALLPVLERRNEPGAALAARLLRAQDEAAAAPDALAAAVDRLVAVVALQEEQIGTAGARRGPALRVFLGESGALSTAFGEGVELVARRDLADIVCFTLAEASAVPMDVGAVLNVLDVRGAAKRPVPLGIGLLLVGSEAEFGAWSDAGVPIAMVPVVVEAADTAGFPPELNALHLVAEIEDAASVQVAAAWARRRGIACGIAGSGGLALVAEFGAAPAMAAGSVMVELRGVAAQVRGVAGGAARDGRGGAGGVRRGEPVCGGGGAGWGGRVCATTSSRA